MSRLLDWRYSTALALIWIGVLVPAIVAGTRLMLTWTAETVIKQDAFNHASELSEHYAHSFPDLGELDGEDRGTHMFLDRLREAMDHGKLLLFKVYTSEGELRHVYGSRPPETAAGPPAAETVRQVAETGTPVTIYRRAKSTEDWPEVVVETYIPVRDGTGPRSGVVAVFFDQTLASHTFEEAFAFLAVGLPAFSALLYLLPTLAWLYVYRQKAERDEKVRELSRLDGLTGLLSRGAFAAEAGKLFGARRGKAGVGVLFLDIDHFKNVNDSHGHEFGDAYLRSAAANLQSAVRANDIVARVGGDEFVAVLPGITAEELTAVAWRAIDRLSQPFSFKGNCITGHASIGTHLAYPPTTLEAALHAADLALYHAKDSGRNMVVPYSEKLDLERERRRTIEAALSGAWAQGRAALVYQPVVRGFDSKIMGFEALMRLTTQDGEEIGPDEFIPVAEQTGLIHELGFEALRRAITAAKMWPEGLFVSVNLSPAQFRRKDLADRICWLVDELDFRPARLELEITESLLLGEEQQITDQLAAIKRAGVSVAMDDFGTGYSSLRYLVKYRFDKLKIDRLFLNAYDAEPERQKNILETIVLLGRQLGMSVTVEGVERQEQADLLRPLNCDLLQGYLFGRPMREAETIAALRAASPGLRSRTT